MAGERLQQWSTLPHEELVKRVANEQTRLDLSFEETQLLNAALERLNRWKMPLSHNRSKAMQEDKKVEDTATVENNMAVAEQLTGATVKKKPASKTAKPTTTTTTTTTQPKEANVAKKAKSAKPAAKKSAKPAKKPAAKPAAKKAAAGGTKTRISDEAVLRVKKSFKNPYKEGSGPYKRFEVCAKSDGKTYGALRAMASLKPTTPLNFVRAGGGDFIDSGK